MSKRLIREASHQALVALCEAVQDGRPYSQHYPLVWAEYGRTVKPVVNCGLERRVA